MINLTPVALLEKLCQPTQASGTRRRCISNSRRTEIYLWIERGQGVHVFFPGCNCGWHIDAGAACVGTIGRQYISTHVYIRTYKHIHYSLPPSGSYKTGKDEKLTCNCPVHGIPKTTSESPHDHANYSLPSPLHSPSMLPCARAAKNAAWVRSGTMLSRGERLIPSCSARLRGSRWCQRGQG